MITFFYRNVREQQLAQLTKFRTGTWINVEAPTEDELKLLTSQFGLDADLLTDALDPDEIPRLETEGDNLYVYMRYSHRNANQVMTSPVLFVVGPKFVASISRLPLPDLARLSESGDLFTTQRAKLLLQLMRYAVGTYDRNVTFLTRQIRGVRAKLNVANVNNRVFVQFVTIEDALNDFLSELGPVSTLLNSLLSGRYNGKYNLTFFEEDKDLIEDLIQMTRQLNETCRGSLRTIVNIREAYSNIMTNNLNRQVQLLTTLTIVLTIPTVVFRYFGMNVPLPGQNLVLTTIIVTLGTVGVCGLILWILFRKRWL